MKMPFLWSDGYVDWVNVAEEFPLYRRIVEDREDKRYKAYFVFDTADPEELRNREVQTATFRGVEVKLPRIGPMRIYVEADSDGEAERYLHAAISACWLDKLLSSPGREEE